MAPLRGGSFHAAGDCRTKPREVPGVPGIDGLRLRFDCAMGEKGVVNSAAGDAERGGRLKRLEIFLVVETYDRQPLPYITEEQHRFVAADALPARPAGNRGINFRQAVSSAAGFVLPEAEKEIDAELMKLMMRVKGGDQDGGIKECFHRGRSPVF